MSDTSLLFSKLEVSAMGHKVSREARKEGPNLGANLSVLEVDKQVSGRELS